MSIYVAPKFQAGDVVILNSGGSLMTVEQIRTEDDLVSTVWFDDAEVRRDSFDSISLVKIK